MCPQFRSLPLTIGRIPPSKEYRYAIQNNNSVLWSVSAGRGAALGACRFPGGNADTQETLRSLTNDAEKREWLTSIVLRKEVQERLREHGLSKKESLSRVNSMTDEEVASAVDQIEEYVAAGDPLWRADGEKDAGQVFALVIGILVLGCLAFCWIIFL